MDKLSRFKDSCPFLARSSVSALRTLSTSSSPRFPSISLLTERATKCPIMGPALTVRSNQIVAGYANIAGNIEHHNMDPSVGIEQCPHASAARAAARMAQDLAAATKLKEMKRLKELKASQASQAKPSACPFHHGAAESS